MGVHVIRVPDIGEGIAETELAEWLVAVGDLILEDQPVAAVMTDKATVEIPSPVSGRVLALGAAPGEIMAVGAELMRLEVEGQGNLSTEAAAAPPPPPVPQAPASAPVAAPAAPVKSKPQPVAPSAPLPRPLAAPSVRALAQEKGFDLRNIRGTGPEGRILREDVEGHDPAAAQAGAPRRNLSVEEVPVIGLRRRISQRMEQANRIPHITIVEEIQVQALEALRSTLNTRPGRKADQPKLTLLPFLARAVVLTVAEQPVMNAHYDSQSGILRKFGAVHLGIAAQTPQGLIVPVLRHAEALALGETAREIARLAEAAREGRATREELSGSTITISSLGPLGAIATTPILNAPEVAIIGVNRMETRPHWNGSGFEPRQMMNLSCSFDHRVIDGWDAAVFVQRLKELLESPALLFVEV
ncbi:dihydrolipoamide acetyltransferase family protein [Falsigemmobacter intermedius]|uniref:dihydrolipoamide acetyltransferase family protein n=1 Tax=Falsigemmobacter intermedius TaxID=1553448 RepID=UPI003F06DFF6